MDPSEAIRVAYRRMAAEARYRPNAPSDGFGNIDMPLIELDLDDEAARYAADWMREEQRGQFAMGVPDATTATAMVFTVEAARMICEGFIPGALERVEKLLEMALEEIRGVSAEVKRGAEG